MLAEYPADAWDKGWDYREKNFAREALTVNPAKACQPLGAILAARGFAGTLPLVLMIMTADEVSYYKNGGILQTVLRKLAAETK